MIATGLLRKVKEVIALFPDEIIEMTRFLENVEFSVTECVVTQSCGDKHITLQNGEIAVRIISDRGIWYVDVAREPGVDWYDIAIVKEEVLGLLGEDVLSLEEQWEFLVAQMSKIKAVLLAADSSQRLNHLQERRAKRRLGILYSPPPITP